MSISVTLPSNASANIFASNTQSCYRTQLAQPLHLDGKWEVALTEIHIPCTWLNVTGSNNIIECTIDNSVKDKLTCGEGSVVIIPPGYYGTPQALIKVINNSTIFTADDRVMFEYDVELKKVIVNSSSPYSAIRFPTSSPGLGTMLGFDNIGRWLPHNPCTSVIPGKSVASYQPDMSGGMTSIYIYTDIVEHQHVGDIMAPLLRIIPLDREAAPTVYKVFDVPYYLPVSRNRIDTIEIDLRSDFGEQILFELGKVVAKLHFKRVDD